MASITRFLSQRLKLTVNQADPASYPIGRNRLSVYLKYGVSQCRRNLYLSCASSESFGANREASNAGQGDEDHPCWDEDQSREDEAHHSEVEVNLSGMKLNLSGMKLRGVSQVWCG